MNASTVEKVGVGPGSPVTPRLQTLLRADAASLAAWVRQADLRSWFFCLTTILLGSGVYGCTLGIWRASLQSVYTAIKFPLLVFLTCAGNALINGMLAQVLGSGLSFKETSLAILMSFTLASLVLASLAPVSLFIWFNAPSLDSSNAIVGHSLMLLTHVFFIAWAGIVANRRLFGLLRELSGGVAVARRVLCSWLAGNLFLGAQLAWNLRPFIGAPKIAVQFLRDDPLRGNFYEAVWRAFLHLFH